MSRMVATSLSGSSVAPVFPSPKVNAEPSRNVAEIIRLNKAKLPTPTDYARACARLIWATFPASSQAGVCNRAAQETRLASADTFDRILSGKTQRIDSYLMQAVKTFAHMRGVAIPPELAVRS